MSDIVTKIDLTDKNGILLNTEKKYCRRNILVLPKLNALEISENGAYPVPDGFAGNGHVNVNVVPKKETVLVVSENGTYAAPPGTVYTSIVVNVPQTAPGGGEGETPHVHKYTSEVIASSCTTGGFTLHTCACGHSYRSDEKEVLGHRYVKGVCERCGAADPNYNPSNPNVNAGEYHIIVGDSFSVRYEGSSPTVECPSCLTYYDDGGELVFTAAAAGSGVIYIRVSDTLIAQYTVTVAAVATYDYNLKVGDSFEVMYEGSSPTVECPACLTYYIDGGVLVFKATKVGTGTLWLYMSDTLIAKYTIQVAAKEIGDTHVHSYTAKVIPPTCTVGGYTQHICACGNSYRTDEVDPNGHDWRNGWQQVTAATCTTSGMDKRVCFTCGHEETRTVTALGHKNKIVEWGNGLAYECERCGAHTPIPNETCDHSSAEVIEYVAPTCTKDGYTTYECSMCGHKWTEHDGKLGHNPDNPRLTNTPTCEVCAHFKVVCTRCGFLIDEYDDDGVFGEHDWCDPIVVAPTCTKAGYTRVVCNECGTLIDTPGDAASGHDYQLVSDSSMSSGCAMKCTICGDRYEASYDCDILGHTTKEGAYDVGGEAMYKCKYCNEYYPVDCTHNYTSTVTKEPTCTATGVRKYSCSLCKHTYTEDIPKTAHIEGEPVLTNGDQMNCQVSAHYKVNCKDCGEFIREYDDDSQFGECKDDNPANIPPTCTSHGYTIFICNVCSKRVETFTAPELGHELELVADSDYSSGAAWKCTRCTHVEEASYYDCDILGHETQDGEYDMPDGSTAFKCKHCGEFYN